MFQVIDWPSDTCFERLTWWLKLWNRAFLFGGSSFPPLCSPFPWFYCSFHWHCPPSSEWFSTECLCWLRSLSTTMWLSLRTPCWSRRRRQLSSICAALCCSTDSMSASPCGWRNRNCCVRRASSRTVWRWRCIFCNLSIITLRYFTSPFSKASLSDTPANIIDSSVFVKRR